MTLIHLLIPVAARDGTAHNEQALAYRIRIGKNGIPKELFEFILSSEKRIEQAHINTGRSMAFGDFGLDPKKVYSADYLERFGIMPWDFQNSFHSMLMAHHYAQDIFEKSMSSLYPYIDSTNRDALKDFGSNIHHKN